MSVSLEQESLSNDRPVYTFEEAVKASTEYFGGDETAGKAFIDKYALKDSFGNLYEKTPDDMHRRLANELARIEKKYENPMSEDEIHGLLKDFKYIVPQGGPMTGIGNDYQIASLSNCYVIGNEGPSDSYGAILKIDQEQVQLMKRRGGVGHDLSHIRPKESPVLNSALTSTGVVPFMERYSNSTREVAQDGRRGALMLSISSKHPDSEDFIDAKLEKGKVTGANVSVRIDNEFMKSVVDGKPYVQQFPVDSDNPTYTKDIDAQKIWKKIVHNAWKSAEPGILFWDTIINESVPDSYARAGEEMIETLKKKSNGDLEKLALEDKELFKTAKNMASYKTVSTNPCGEIPLCPYDSCRLLAINLHSYVDKPFTEEATFNFDKFKEHAGYAQKLMDDIVDLELEKIDAILDKVRNDPEEAEVKHVEKILWKKIRHKAEEGRRTGVGVTGEGDMLAGLGLRYGSDKGNDFSEEVHKTLAIESYRSSVNMVKDGRSAFAIYDAEIEKDNPFIQRITSEEFGDLKLGEEMKKYGRRNISLLTIAPTGTTSLMTQTTSGIEPVFLPVYKRRKKVDANSKKNRKTNVAFTDELGDEWEEFTVFHHKFVDWLKVKGYNPEEVQKCSDEELQKIVEKSPYYKATSKDVDWMKKVELQGRVQKYVDHSISVTINLPEDTKEDLVGELYVKAWESGCKGVTVYRDGSRDGVLISGKEDKKGGGLEKITLVQKNVKPHLRLDVKPQAIKYKIKRDFDRLHMIPTSDLYVDDKNKLAYFLPDENFTNRLPPGSTESASFTMEGILLSNAFRGADPNYVALIETFQSVYSDENQGIGPNKLKSKEHAMGLVLEHYFLTNGIVERDPQFGKLVQVVKKPNLRKVKSGTDEYKNILSQVKIGDNEEEIIVSGTNGKLDFKFECPKCGGTDYHFENACDNPICSCGWSDPNKSCG